MGQINFTAAMKKVESSANYVSAHQKNILGEASLEAIRNMDTLNSMYADVLINLNIEKRIPTATMSSDEVAECTEFMKEQADKYVTEYLLANVLFNNSVQKNHNVRQIPMFKSGYVNAKGQLVTQHKAGSKANTAFTAVRCYLAQGESLKIATNLEIGENLIANFSLVGTFRRGYDEKGKAVLLVAGVVSVTNTDPKNAAKSSATVTFVYGDSTTENGKLEPVTTFTKNISDIKVVSLRDGEEVAGQGFEDVLNALFDENEVIQTTIQSDKQIKGSLGNIKFFNASQTAVVSDEDVTFDDDEF